MAFNSRKARNREESLIQISCCHLDHKSRNQSNYCHIEITQNATKINFVIKKRLNHLEMNHIR